VLPPLLLLDTEVTSSDTNKEEAKGRNDKAGRPPPGRSETKEEGEEEEEGTAAAASILSPTKTCCYYWLYLFPHNLSLASVRFFPPLSRSLSSYSLSLELSRDSVFADTKVRGRRRKREETCERQTLKKVGTKCGQQP
jgi:hypothetical protein